MEVVVSGCIGLLSCLCAFEVLALSDDAQRANGGRAIAAHPGAPPLRTAIYAAAAAVGRVLRERGAVAARIEDALGEVRELQAPVTQLLKDTSNDEAVGLMVFASMASGLILFVLTGSLPGACLGCAAPCAGLFAAALSERRRRRSRIEEAMPEAFGALAVSLGSGLSLAQAMRYVGGHAEEPVRTSFMRVAFSITCGIPATEALDAMIVRLRAPGLELVTLALKISQRTGAPLKGLLSDASKLVGERIELARRLDVKTSQARLSARLVACMPVAMIAFLSLFSSDFQKGVATVAGMASIVVALAMNAAAWFAIKKIMRIHL